MDIETFSSLRDEAERRLFSKPNVVGLMIGAKETAGTVRDGTVFTVLVDRKLAPAELDRKDRIPSRLSIRSRTVRTDVLQVQGWVNQNTVFPPNGALSTHDGLEYGTMSAFGRSRLGLFGLTCAHAVEGRDRDPDTPDPVSIWSPRLGRPVPVGETVQAVVGGGAGIPGAFGFSDAAIFTLADAELRDRAGRAASMGVADAVPGEAVWGDAASGPKTDTVVGVHLRYDRKLIDVVVRIHGQGTYRGDSGMAWRNAQGRAVSIHAKGDGNGPGVPSGLSAGMSAGRAATAFGLDLLAF